MDQALRRAIERHQIGYQIAAHTLKILLREAFYDRGLRRFADEVIDLDLDDQTPEFLEKCALIMLAGAAAVADVKDYSHRDELEARDLLFYAYYRHHGDGVEQNDKRHLSQFVESRVRILKRQAEELVRKHLKPRKPRPDGQPDVQARDPDHPQAASAPQAEAPAVEAEAEYHRLVLMPVVDG